MAPAGTLSTPSSLPQRPTNSTAPAPQNKRPIVVSGPSGTGKSTLLNRLLADHPDTFEFSVSHTTRAPRAGEQEGRNYYFVTKEAFEHLIAEDGFLEHAQFSGHYYGTSKKALQDIAQQGKIGILDIEMEGVKQVKQSPMQARYLFIAPPSLQELEARLRARGTEGEESVRKRLAQAEKEIEFSKREGVHDKIVVNEDLEAAYREVREFTFADNGGAGSLVGGVERGGQSARGMGED